MITFKTPFVWLVIINLILMPVASIKACFFLQLPLNSVMVGCFFIILYFGFSWHCYFNGILFKETESGSNRYGYISKGDVEFFRVMSKPIAYFLSSLLASILFGFVFFSKK
jgi:hypothetical protein